MERRRRRWWTWSLSVAATLVVLAATLSLGFRFVVDAVPGYRDRLQAKVSEAVGHPVQIGAITLTWHGLRPSLDLRDLALLDTAGHPALRMERLRLGFSLLRLATADLIPDTVEVHGLKLEADVDELGHWSLRGFGGGSAAPHDFSADLERIARLKRVRLRNSSLLLHDPQLSRAPLTFGINQVEVQHSGEHYTMAAQLAPPALLAAQASGSGTLDGDLARPETWKGGWTVQLAGIEGWPWLLHHLRPGVRLRLDGAQLRLAGKVDGGHISEIDAQAQAQAVTAVQGKDTLAQVSQLQLDVAATPESNAWTTEIRRLVMDGARGTWPQAQGRFHYAVTPQGDVLDATADGLRLDDLLPWLALAKDLPESAARLRDARGDVHDLTLHYEQPAAPDGAAPRYSLHARLAGAGLASSNGQPGFTGVDTVIDATQDGGHAVLQQAALEVDLPDTFAQPLPVKSLSGDFSWSHAASGADAGWRIAAPQFDWQLLTCNGHGSFSLLLPQDAAASPRIALTADFSSDDVTAFKPYMPKNWGAGARDWLNRALQKVRLPQGHLQLDGPLADYPFVEKPDGHYMLDLGVADGTLAYAPGWPAAEKMQALLKFRGHGLQIIVSGASLAGNSIDGINAVIPDLNKGQLSLDGSIHGAAQRFYDVLRGSPVKQKLAGLLDQTEADGPASLNLHLEIPLAGDHIDVLASGTVHFDGNALLTIQGLDQPIRGLRGAVSFDDHGVHSDGIGGQLYGSTLKGNIHPEPTSPDGVLEVQTDTPVNDDDGLFAQFVPQWLRNRMSGTLHVTGRMPFSGAHNGQLVVSSDLRGVGTSLPAPLAKGVDDSLPLSVAIGEGGTGRPPTAAGDSLRILIDAGERMRAALRFAHPPGAPGKAMPLRGVELLLGPGGMPHAEADGISVGGAPLELDFEQWQAVIDAINAPSSGGSDTGGPGLPFLGADLTPQRLFYGDLSVRQVHLVVKPGPTGWSVLLDGANAQGRIDYDKTFGGRVLARLQRLTLDALPAGPAAPPPAGAPAEGPPFDPNQAPALDVSCDALQIGNAKLGHLNLQTQRIDGGQAMSRLQLRGGELQTDSHGSWLRRNGSSSATLAFEMSSTNLGQTLQAFGYADTMDAKNAKVSGDLSWAPAPAGLQLALAQGTIKLEVKDGSLNVVKPGAGRVLGLFNLIALPKRLLTFDFHDVVAKGLGFDTVTGSFKLGDGQAQTNDLKLEAPAMKLTLNGRIGLAARDYDQKVTVYPNVTTGVAVGATLIGGPIAGGIALLAQEVFNKPFNALSQFSYHVTGSWDNPQIKGSGSEPPKPLLPPPAPPPVETPG
jgi:uncharacterized protein (TIGR02099 family)